MSDLKEAKKLVEYDEEKHGLLENGPVNFDVDPVDIKCPKCGEEDLCFVSKQWTYCPAGIYPVDILIDHYRCSECDEIFVEEVA